MKDPKFCSLLNYCHAAITSTRIDPTMFLVAFPSGALAGPTGITCPGSAIEPHLIGYYFTKTKQTPCGEQNEGGPFGHIQRYLLMLPHVSNWV